MAGLDVIDGRIIEVNVTSPCYFIKEINGLYGVHLEKEICSYLSDDKKFAKKLDTLSCSH